MVEINRTVGEKIKESFREAVARSAPNRIQQAVQMGSHRLIADVPVEQGGEDAGARPRELVSAALAACISMTVNGYARRKEWPLTEAVVKVQLNESDRGKLFNVEVELTGPLSAEQKERLLRVGSQCSVGELVKIGVRLTLKETVEKN
jgi:putative redox protein